MFNTVSKSDLVRQTCAEVIRKAKHVTIDRAKLKAFGSKLQQQQQKPYIDWCDYSCHLQGYAPEIVVDYIFALDTLNFCFWPQPGYEYEDLAHGLCNMIKEDQQSLKPINLLKLTPEDLKDKIFKGLDFPLLDERTRLLHDTASITLKYFDGEYLNILKKTNRVSQDLLDVLTSYYLGFQDHAIYDGRQVFFYKRAQILIADIYAAFNGKGYGDIFGIDKLTMFPDYRVPQILHHEGVLIYDQKLNKDIINKQILPHGSEQEIEIRAATIIVVEELKHELNLTSIQVDWMLWQLGEQQRDQIVPHHRTLSIYY